MFGADFLGGAEGTITLEYERTRSRRPGAPRLHIVGNGRRDRAQSESGALSARHARRQLVRHWGVREGINVSKARAARLRERLGGANLESIVSFWENGTDALGTFRNSQER
jgi:hypothetical protein